jgi:hypothetical protein
MVVLVIVGAVMHDGTLIEVGLAYGAGSGAAVGTTAIRSNPPT